MHVLPNELSLDYHLYSSKAAEFPSQEHGKRQPISRQLPTPTCCHTLQHRLVETQEEKKTTKPCRGLGRLICLASVSVLGRQQRLWQRQQGAGRHSCLPEGTSFGGIAGRTGPFAQARAPKLEQSLPSCFATLLHVLNPPALTCGLGISSVLPVCPGRAKLHPGSSQHCHRQPRQQEREQQHCWGLLPQLPEHPPQTKPTQSILKIPCRCQAGQRCGQQECREDERQLLC